MEHDAATTADDGRLRGRARVRDDDAPPEDADLDDTAANATAPPSLDDV